MHIRLLLLLLKKDGAGETIDHEAAAVAVWVPLAPVVLDVLKPIAEILNARNKRR